MSYKGGFYNSCFGIGNKRIAKTSKATATHDLQDLVAKLAVIKIGERKSTRYYLNLADSNFGQEERTVG